MWVSLYTLPMMLGASQFWLVRRGFYFAAAGAELPVVWSIMLVVQAMLGKGPYAVKIASVNRRSKRCEISWPSWCPKHMPIFRS